MESKIVLTLYVDDQFSLKKQTDNNYDHIQLVPTEGYTSFINVVFHLNNCKL